MSKIHKLSGSVCMICDEDINGNFVLFHKTRRQTHKLCLECCISYLKPKLKLICNNIRKNILNNIGIIKCPGTYHCESRNQCNKNIRLLDLNIPQCDISLNIFRITYVLSNNNTYLCPEEKCGQVIEVDNDYLANKLMCQDCKTTWCKQCLSIPYHLNKSCLEFEIENRNTKNGKFILEMKKAGKIKFCPQCRAPCFKNNGCNKMICSQCGVKWCWLCLEKYIDYEHYNSNNIGSCTGKLWKGVDKNGNDIEIMV
jgi:hypothetical protein